MHTLSFCLLCMQRDSECNEVAEMYNPELWPDGALVRPYYEPHRGSAVRVNSTTAMTVSSDTDLKWRDKLPSPSVDSEAAAKST